MGDWASGPAVVWTGRGAPLDDTEIYFAPKLALDLLAESLDGVRGRGGKLSGPGYHGPNK